MKTFENEIQGYWWNEYPTSEGSEIQSTASIKTKIKLKIFGHPKAPTLTKSWIELR